MIIFNTDTNEHINLEYNYMPDFDILGEIVLSSLCHYQYIHEEGTSDDDDICCMNTSEIEWWTNTVNCLIRFEELRTKLESNLSKEMFSNFVILLNDLELFIKRDNGTRFLMKNSTK